MNLSRLQDRTFLLAVLGILVGGVLLVIGANVSPTWLSILLFNVGAFVIASVAMALIFQFWQLRSLLDDLYEHARITTQLRQARLSGFSVAFHDGVPWEELFTGSASLQLMVAYAATWRNAQQARLEALVDKAGSRLEVILPNPEAVEVCEELGRRFDTNVDETKKRIEEAIQFYRVLQSRTKGTMRIYLYNRPPLFTFYIFDRRAVFTTYRHSRGRGPILTLMADRGGEMFTWLTEEWNAITGAESKSSGVVRELTLEMPTAPPA